MASTQLTMDNKRAFIRHEILNIVTLVNFLIIDSEIKEDEKESILEHLKMVALLTAEQELFVENQSKAFFNQKIDLDQMFWMISDILEPEAKKKKVKLTIAATDATVFADSNALKNGLENLLRYLFQITKKIHIEASSSSLIVRYDGPDIKGMDKGALIQYLEEKHSYPEIFCRVGVELMQMNHFKIKFGKSLITIQFPKKK